MEALNIPLRCQESRHPQAGRPPLTPTPPTASAARTGACAAFELGCLPYAMRLKTGNHT